MIKQARAVTWLAGMLFALTGIFAGEALAGISATKHNLSSSHTKVGQTIYSSDQTEICIFCHTPHQAIKNADIPLWNHQLSSVVAYGVYDSPTFDGAIAKGGDIADLGGLVGGKDSTGATASNLCLSCHDGTVAINSFSNLSNETPTTTMVGVDAGTGGIPGGATPPATNLGSDLKDDHPVNFSYDAALFGRDPTLNDPATLTGVKLFANKVQCASCHDPHTSDVPTFLRVSMASSGLCTACHAK